MFEPVIRSMGYELVGIEISGGSQHSTLRVYIDREEGVNVEDCAAISHQISGILDVEEPFQQAFDLEISSPGVDRPLFNQEDYERFTGRMAKIRMAVPLDGRRNFKGELQGISQSRYVKIKVDNEGYELPLSDIAKANLIGEI
ncbi:MAG: ribosome maturation factor RimP [Proteobacteria bacterium]|nr:ribosome maturation factor RimP [Pseudomonadota bacterium]